MDDERYYIFCDESGNDNKHPVVGCVVIEKKKYDELLSIIKPKYLEYEKQNPKFEEIHFATFKSEHELVKFTLDIIQYVSERICFYSLILNEKIDNNNKKDHYYNILLNKALEDFNIEKEQIKQIAIDNYNKKQERRKIGKFECCFIDSQHKKSNSDLSYFLQICDCLIGTVRYIKNNQKNKSDIISAFCNDIKNIFSLDNLITINQNWIVKDYKK
ncbi:MAG: DUF3800 domain-containing protein [Rickettsiales bacterium]|nr:DUF3800 domain-containing protein [Rickettsiales bacterium]